MKGRIALVTGGAAGIGAEVCRQLAAAGAHVVIVDVDADTGQALAEGLGGTFVTCNVADRDAWFAAVEEVVARVGPPDYAHLNAGVMSVTANEPFLPIEALPLDCYRRIVGVNLDGVVFGLQALIPRMRDRDVAITVTASTAGLVALPIDPMYCATKHALIGLVRSVAAALAKSRLRLNAICPGGVDTAIVPDALRAASIAMMSREEIAREVVSLLRDGASGEIRVKVGAGVDAYAFPVPLLG
jgi:NAD(P)-dependent dehydrogenase (short-subunit alcohol dehydrogenase family)